MAGRVPSIGAALPQTGRADPCETNERFVGVEAPLAGVLWLQIGGEFVEVDQATADVRAGEVGLIMDRFGALRLMAGPLESAGASTGPRRVFGPQVETSIATFREALILIGRVAPRRLREV